MALPPAAAASGTVGSPVPSEALLRQLQRLDKDVQSQLAEEHSFRKANASFSPTNETTQLLISAAEKLATERDAKLRANFEEHASELPYLCKRFGTSIEAGHSDRSYREHASEALPPAACQERRRKGVLPFLLCCQREFPPQQVWWLSACRRLTPGYQVLRNGSLAAVAGRELVPGDVLFLASGQRCPVDARVLVHEAGTLVECSHLTMEARDVRKITAEMTCPSVTDSANIVLRDSYVITGSCFGMVVRSQMNSLIPRAIQEAGEDEFCLDTGVPTGMAPSQCRALFKQLVVKKRLVCRSFACMVKLARVQVVLVLLSLESDVASASMLCAAVKWLNRAVVFVTVDCKPEASEALAKELGCEVVDVRPLGCDTDALSTAAQSAIQSVTESNGKGTSGLSSPFSGCLSSVTVQRQDIIGHDMKTRLQSLAGNLVGRSTSSVVLHRPQQETIATLCQLLSEQGAPPLLALGGLQCPAPFGSLVVGARYARTRASLQCVGCSSFNDHLPTPVYTSAADGRTPRESARLSSISRQTSHMSGRGSSSPSRSMQFQSTDPVQNSPCFVPKGEHGKPSIELSLSVNSVGALSDFSDCTLLSSDLGLLGQALELCVKTVPASAVAAMGRSPSSSVAASPASAVPFTQV